MLLTLSATMEDARDLGFLLHKHPDRVQVFDVTHGRATVLFPEASEERCEVALLLDVDRDAVASAWRGRGEALAAYVNDRPYASGSLLGTALGKVFRSALNGVCAARPDLPGRVLDLEVHVPALRVRSASLAWEAFDALGWDASALPLDLPGLDEDAGVVSLHLTGSFRLQDALSHLAVLLPALDAGSPHFVTEEDALRLARVAPWLAAHPLRLLVLRRLLAGQRDLVDLAHQHLGVEAPQPRETLADVRMGAVRDVLLEVGAESVVDFGCGEGRLLSLLAPERAVRRLLGVDVGVSTLRRAERALEALQPHHRRKVRLVQSSALVPDSRLTGDTAVLVEVVEHLDPWRLLELEEAVFARFDRVVLTTPNAEYNALLGPGLRHADHRFEWSRHEASAWAAAVAARHGFVFESRPVGVEDPLLGPPTQLLLFTRSPRA